MDHSQFIANCLPFLMAYILLILKGQMRTLAENTLRIVAGENVTVNGRPKELAIKLALHFYRQLSFVLSVILSAVSALALTASSIRPLIGILAAFVLIVAMATWFFRWQTLSATSDEQRNRLDREMAIVAYATTTLMLGATLCARWR